VTTTDQRDARHAYHQFVDTLEWELLRERLARRPRGRRCAVHGRRCRGGPLQAHHWSRRFYRRPGEEETWMLVLVCRRSHRLIHRLAWVSAIGRDRLTWLPLWTGLVVADGKTLQAVAGVVQAVARSVAR
jgi:hypothetical protein